MTKIKNILENKFQFYNGKLENAPAVIVNVTAKAAHPEKNYDILAKVYFKVGENENKEDIVVAKDYYLNNDNPLNNAGLKPLLMAIGLGEYDSEYCKLRGEESVLINRQVLVNTEHSHDYRTNEPRYKMVDGQPTGEALFEMTNLFNTNDQMKVHNDKLNSDWWNKKRIEIASTQPAQQVQTELVGNVPVEPAPIPDAFIPPFQPSFNSPEPPTQNDPFANVQNTPVNPFNVK